MKRQRYKISNATDKKFRCSPQGSRLVKAIRETRRILQSAGHEEGRELKRACDWEGDRDHALSCLEVVQFKDSF